MTSLVVLVVGLNLEGVKWQIALPIWVVVLVLRYVFYPSFLVLMTTGRIALAGPLSDREERKLEPS